MLSRSKTTSGEGRRRAAHYGSRAEFGPSILVSARASPITACACICPATAGLRCAFEASEVWRRADPWIARMDARGWRGARSFICAWRYVTAIPTGRDGKRRWKEIAAEARSRLAALDAPHDTLDASAAESLARWRASARPCSTIRES